MKLIKRRIKKRKFYLRLFSTLLFFSAVPMLILAVLTSAYSSKLLDEEINHSIGVMQNQLKEKLDSNIENMRDDILNYVTYNSRINSFVYKSNPKDFYMTSYLLADMNQIKSNHEYVEDIVLYIRDINFIMNCEGSMHSEFYFDRFQNREFSQLVNSTGFWKSYYMDGYRTMSDTFDAVLFYTSLPINSDKSNIFLAVVINKNRLLKDIEAFHLMKSGGIYVIDENDIPVVGYVPDGSPDWESVAPILEKAEEKSDVYIGRDRYMCIAASSAVTNWRYLSLIPYQEVTDKTQNIALMTVVLGIVMIFLAFCASMFLSRWLYTPIGSLMHKMQNASSMPVRREHEAADEFSFITTNIDRMIYDNQDLQYRILKTVPMLRQSFLKELFHRQVGGGDLIQMMDMYQISLPNRNFVVFLFYSKEQERATEHIRQVFRESFTNYYAVEEDGFTAVLLNYNEYDLNQIKKRFEGCPYAVAQGQVYDSAEDIAKSYGQARYALQYRIARKCFEYLGITETVERDFSKYKLPVHYEEQYQNCLELKEYDNAYRLIQNLVEGYIHEDTPFFFVEKTVDSLYAFAETVAGGYHVALAGILKDQTDFVLWKNADRTLDDDRDYLLQVFKRLLEYQKSSGISRDDEVIGRAMEIIEENYLADDFSLDNIADALGVSYTYLSKLFKKSIGEGFVEYITRRRIEYSIELLKDQSLSIDRIAGMVGYMHTPTYIRNFKKIKGVSPGKYRNLL